MCVRSCFGKKKTFTTVGPFPNSATILFTSPQSDASMEVSDPVGHLLVGMQHHVRNGQVAKLPTSKERAQAKKSAALNLVAVHPG